LVHRPYYGIGPHFIQYAALNSIRFGSYNAATSFMSRRHSADPQNAQLPLSDIFACGAFSGVCIAATLHPLFVVKTHQQNNRLGTREAALRLWQGEGLRGLFRTYLAGFARFPFALGVFFTSYEALKRCASDVTVGAEPSEAQDSFRMVNWMGAGAIAGILCWTSVYPLDVVQSRVIGQASYGVDRTYSGVLSCFAKLYRQEGLRAFTRGYSAVLLRSGPVNAVLLPVSDCAKPLAERLLPAP